jgi:hypothetical protein
MMRNSGLSNGEGGGLIEGGEWRIEDRTWRMEVGGWRLEDGGSRTEVRRSRKPAVGRAAHLRKILGEFEKMSCAPLRFSRGFFEEVRGGVSVSRLLAGVQENFGFDAGCCGAERRKGRFNAEHGNDGTWGSYPPGCARLGVSREIRVNELRTFDVFPRVL